MYIIAIGWLYVVILMAAAEKSLVAGLMTVFWYGVLPLGLFLRIAGTRQRKRKALRRMADKHAHQPDGADSKGDQ